MQGVRRMLLVALALIIHAAATGEPSLAYREARHQRNLLQTTNRAGTATEQVIGRLDFNFGLERQEALPSPGGKQAVKNHGSEPDGPASKPSAIPGLHEAIADLSIGIGSSGSYSPGHGARRATTIPQMEEGLRAEGPGDSRDDIDSAGTASMERRQGKIAPTPCSPLRCSFNVDSAGTLSRVEGLGCADPECQALDLEDRGIKAIATDAFSGMVNLKVLIMNNNQLGYISNSHLQDLVVLEDLYMSYNHLTSISKGTFRGLSSLKSLDLMYNAIGSITAETFIGLSGLKRLAMGHQRSNPKAQFSTGILSSIEDGSFRHMPLLEDLDLEYHVLSKISNGMLGGGLSNLKFLNLQGSRLPADFTKDFLLVEPHAFTGLASLETLDFSFAGVNSKALKPGLFRCCTRLKSLALSSNPIEALTASAFAGLGNSLETLNLMMCMISRLSSRTFRGLTRLEILSLGYNRLSVVPSEVFATLPESCFVSVVENSMSCRPKTAKDAEPDSNTTYPHPANVNELDLSLSLCPVQEDQEEVEVLPCVPGQPADGAQVAPSPTLGAGSSDTSDSKPPKSTPLGKSPSPSTRASLELWLAVGSIIAAIILLPLSAVVRRAFCKPKRQFEDDDASSLQEVRGRGIVGFNSSMPSSSMNGSSMRYDREATVPSPPQPRPSALPQPPDSHRFHDSDPLSTYPHIPRPNYPELKFPEGQDIPAGVRRPPNAPPPPRPSRAVPPLPPDDSHSEAEQSSRRYTPVQQTTVPPAVTESATDTGTPEGPGAPARAMGVVCELDSHPLYRAAVETLRGEGS